MYDLTSFFTTISVESASFVAILGGLIAQKVIEINNEKAAVGEELKELQKKKESLENDIDDLLTLMEEDDAVTFIGNHAKEYIQEKEFFCCG